ncbi:hypothetical protein GWI33_001673 [Rhynchophorus ferrugineus]|uniref:Uncharacterized protein n=1 Tax=Rhynchophorus ferrugineus TaxID=354439 RepID=A0A834MKG3_RHYFE|nr:hypothetical protein GWI33_001673 [Rhynchophorus ferrugineus]
MCNQNKSHIKTIAIPSNKLTIDLTIESGSGLMLTYTSYMLNVTYEEMKCSKYRLEQRKGQEACINGMLVDDITCNMGTAPCGNMCYDLEEERCNGVLDCPNGEDELGCDYKKCPNNISCFNQTKCISVHQVCDGKADCDNDFDESHCYSFSCSNENCYLKEHSNMEDGGNSIYVTVVIVVILLIIFLSLIFRCLISRNSVRDTLVNHLDIPLPPFTGPEDNAYPFEDLTYSDDDFQPGGEVFETISHNVDKIKEKRKHLTESERTEVIHVKPLGIRPTHEKHLNDGMRMVLSEELAALATLKITRDRCRGLRKAKSEEKPFTKLLFIDNKDEESSDEYEDKAEGCSTWSNIKLKKKSKSDGDQYLKRKLADTIV